MGGGFFANLAKLSRVYQFNCGNTTVISRKELEGESLKAKLAPGLPESSENLRNLEPTLGFNKVSLSLPLSLYFACPAEKTKRTLNVGKQRTISEHLNINIL